MTNCIIGFKNRIDESIIDATYGSWDSNYPLSYIQNPIISVLARSQYTIAASTRFRFATAQARLTGAIAIVNHNLTATATWRYRVYSDAAYSTLVYDSGTINVWPDMPYGYYEWEDDDFWDLTMSPDQITADRHTLIHAQTDLTNAQYYQVEFFDADNPAGYVSLGRVFLGQTYQPENNMSLGAAISIESDTTVDKSIGGVEFFQNKLKYRVVRMNLAYLDEATAILNQDIMQQSDISAEVLFIWNPASSILNNKNSFMGRLRSLNAVENPYNTIYQTSYEIKELL